MKFGIQTCYKVLTRLILPRYNNFVIQHCVVNFVTTGLYILKFQDHRAAKFCSFLWFTHEWSWSILQSNHVPYVGLYNLQVFYNLNLAELGDHAHRQKSSCNNRLQETPVKLVSNQSLSQPLSVIAHQQLPGILYCAWKSDMTFLHIAIQDVLIYELLYNGYNNHCFGFYFAYALFVLLHIWKMHILELSCLQIYTWYTCICLACLFSGVQHWQQ